MPTIKVIGVSAAGGYDVTPTGVTTVGEVYSLYSGCAAAVTGAAISISDSTATGAVSAEFGSYGSFAQGTNLLMLFDPPQQFGKGVMVNAVASGTGNVSIFVNYSTLSPFISHPRR